MSTKSKNLNSFGSKTELKIAGKTYQYHSLKALEKAGHKLSRIPFSLKILVENLLRQEDGVVVSKADIEAILKWNPKSEPDYEIQFMPARVLLQDFTGVPCVVDLAAMRGALKKLGMNPSQINPLQPVDLVIDHSVQIDTYGTSKAFDENAALEFERNKERYEFLRWGQSGFQNFRVVPPDTGIVHQVNLEFLAHVAMTRSLSGAQGNEEWVFPDTLVGTDSHTTMINGLGVLGWGVGGIEAEAAMLGQPCSMLIPQVVGFRLKGKLKPFVTATDFVLTVTQILRKKGVVGKFVEFFGPGLANLTLADRATIANMAPEYGATCGLFPVDEVTVDYLRLTGREVVAPLVEEYYKAQGLWYSASNPEPEYTDVLELDLDTVEPSLAGPSRPQDRVALKDVRTAFRKALASGWTDVTLEKNPELKSWTEDSTTRITHSPELSKDHPDAKVNPVLAKRGHVELADGSSFELTHGSVVIASITSCTNTSNPAVLIAAGLVAKKAVEKGLTVKPWVKTSLAPGSRVVKDYLEAAGLMPYLEALKFHIAGYGCTTCIGNSGPLSDSISKAITDSKLAVAAVLSGNRNFEGRVHALVRGNYLASPPLVVAYAIAGNVNIDLPRDPIGYDPAGKPVMFDDIWPTYDEIQAIMKSTIKASQYKKSYENVFDGSPEWANMKVPTGEIFKWDSKSTYIKEAPYFENFGLTPPPVKDIKNARVLGLFGDSITTDHISPAGNISKNSPAGIYLQSLGVDYKDFNSYGARRGNHEVMVRGTFANVRIKNLLVPGIEGGVTKHMPSGTQMPIYDAAMKYQSEGIPTVIIAGKEYGTGSSRDWAAKGPMLQGVRAVITESFERIHRSNLVGMGVLPLQFVNGENAAVLKLDGTETFDIAFDLAGGLQNVQTQSTVKVKANKSNGTEVIFEVKVRIDTPNELEYYKNGGILQYVLRSQISKK